MTELVDRLRLRLSAGNSGKWERPHEVDQPGRVNMAGSRLDSSALDQSAWTDFEVAPSVLDRVRVGVDKKIPDLGEWGLEAFATITE